MKCSHCNSEHDADAYSVGYFLVDGEIIEVQGEGAVLAMARDPEFPTSDIYWSRESLEEHRANAARLLEETLALNAYEEEQHKVRVAAGREILKRKGG